MISVLVKNNLEILKKERAFYKIVGHNRFRLQKWFRIVRA